MIYIYEINSRDTLRQVRENVREGSFFVEGLQQLPVSSLQEMSAIIDWVCRRRQRRGGREERKAANKEELKLKGEEGLRVRDSRSMDWEDDVCGKCGRHGAGNHLADCASGPPIGHQQPYPCGNENECHE